MGQRHPPLYPPLLPHPATTHQSLGPTPHLLFPVPFLPPLHNPLHFSSKVLLLPIDTHPNCHPQPHTSLLHPLYLPSPHLYPSPNPNPPPSLPPLYPSPHHLSHSAALQFPPLPPSAPTFPPHSPPLPHLHPDTAETCRRNRSLPYCLILHTVFPRHPHITERS